MKLSLSSIKARASMRPAGYEADVIAHGKVVGDNLEITEADYAALVEKYAGQAARWRDVAKDFKGQAESLKDRGYTVADHSTFSRRLGVCRGGCVYWCDQRGCAEPWLKHATCPTGKWDV